MLTVKTREKKCCEYRAFHKGITEPAGINYSKIQQAYWVTSVTWVFEGDLGFSLS